MKNDWQRSYKKNNREKWDDVVKGINYWKKKWMNNCPKNECEAMIKQLTRMKEKKCEWKDINERKAEQKN